MNEHMLNRVADTTEFRRNFSQLEHLIETRRARVVVIGLGYVGLPLALATLRAGFTVTGFDISRERLDTLAGARSGLRHIDDDDVAEAIASDRFALTGDAGCLDEADVLIICVPTPLSRNREPDLGPVISTCHTLAEHVRRGQLVVLESTTYPGTTKDVVAPILEAGSGLKSGRDFYVSYSPEREDPGNDTYTTATIPKIVGGDGPEARELVALLYRNIVKTVVPVSDTKTAEAVKVTENIFRSVNIALVNELKIVYDTMDIDVWEVIDAAKSKPFGFMPFYPGPGLGGHCVPIDPFYLSWKAREFDMPTRFIELAGEINTHMPHWVVGKLAKAIDEVTGRGLSGSRILLLGIAYKPGVNDMRESPALKLWELLDERGADIDYYDPFVSEVPMTREHPNFAGRRSVDLARIAQDESPQYDAVLIATDHGSVDYDHLLGLGRIVVDTRNVCEREGIDHPNIYKA